MNYFEINSFKGLQHRLRGRGQDRDDSHLHFERSEKLQH
jgi:hypothetical protein